VKAAFAVLPILAAWSAMAAFAGEAKVLDAKATCSAIRTCDFDVEVLHADVGFSHYADRYEVRTPEGEVLGVRVLQHPHVHEQPFVRRLVGVEIPEGVTEVIVRAHDSRHGFGGETVTIEIEIPAKSAPPPQAWNPGPGELAAEENALIA